MCALLVACSETSSVPADDKLFTGLRKTVYENYTPSEHFSTVKEEVEAALATAPNGSFLGSPYIRRGRRIVCVYTIGFVTRKKDLASGCARHLARRQYY